MTTASSTFAAAREKQDVRYQSSSKHKWIAFFTLSVLVFATAGAYLVYESLINNNSEVIIQQLVESNAMRITFQSVADGNETTTNYTAFIFTSQHEGQLEINARLS